MGPKEWNCETSVIQHREGSQLELKLCLSAQPTHHKSRTMISQRSEEMGSCNDMLIGRWQKVDLTKSYGVLICHSIVL